RPTRRSGPRADGRGCSRGPGRTASDRRVHERPGDHRATVRLGTPLGDGAPQRCPRGTRSGSDGSARPCTLPLMGHGTTAIRVELVGGTARATLLHGGTYLRPRLLETVGDRARVALVGSYATLLAGDDVVIDIEVGAGVHLDVVEPTAMVAYAADDVPAQWAASLRVATGATLTWNAAPFVVS